MEIDESYNLGSKVLTRPNICAIMMVNPILKEGIIIADEQRKRQERREINAEIVRELNDISEEQLAELVRLCCEHGLFVKEEPRE